MNKGQKIFLLGIIIILIGSVCIAAEPLVIITFPLNQSYNSSMIGFNLTLPDTLGSWCGFYKDTNLTQNNISMTADSNASHWNYTLLDIVDGPHNVTFICNDTSNNYNQSFINNVTFYSNVTKSVITQNDVYTYDKSPNARTFGYILVFIGLFYLVMISINNIKEDGGE